MSSRSTSMMAWKRAGVARALSVFGHLGVFGHLLVNTHLEVGQGLGHGGVEGNHGAGAVGAGARRTELEAVASEGEGRRAVAVGIVDDEVGNLWNVNLSLEIGGLGLEIGGLLNVVKQF